MVAKPDILHIPKQNLKNNVNKHANLVSNVNIKLNTEKKLFKNKNTLILYTYLLLVV